MDGGGARCEHPPEANMRTDDITTTSGVYLTQCECAVCLEIRRGDDAPACPTCGRIVGWAFQRGTYGWRAGPSHAPAAEPTELHGRVRL